MGDWEDDMWEYAQEGSFYDEDKYEDEPYEGEQDEEGEYEEGDGGEEGGEEPGVGYGEEDIEFTQDYKQLQQTGRERRSALGTAGLSEGLQKAQRTPEEATLDQVEGVISSTYPEISDTIRQKVISKIEKLKSVYLYNVEVLVLASIWSVEGRELTKKGLQDFFAKYKNRVEITVVDLVRYIRILSMRKT